jgi:hypothetical protein
VLKEMLERRLSIFWWTVFSVSAKRVTIGKGMDFENIKKGDVTVTDYDPRRDLAVLLNLSQLPESILSLIDEVSEWLWEDQDGDDSHLGLSESEIARGNRALNKQASESSKHKSGYKKPRKQSNSIRSQSGFRPAPREAKEAKASDKREGVIETFDLAGFKAILDEKNNRVRMSGNLLINMLQRMESWISELPPHAQREYLGMNFKKICNSLISEGSDPMIAVEEDASEEKDDKKSKAEEAFDDYENDLEEDIDEDGNNDRNDDAYDINAPGVPLHPLQPGVSVFLVDDSMQSCSLSYLHLRCEEDTFV